MDNTENYGEYYKNTTHTEEQYCSSEEQDTEKTGEDEIKSTEYNNINASQIVLHKCDNDEGDQHSIKEYFTKEIKHNIKTDFMKIEHQSEELCLNSNQLISIHKQEYENVYNSVDRTRDYKKHTEHETSPTIECSVESDILPVADSHGRKKRVRKSRSRRHIVEHDRVETSPSQNDSYDGREDLAPKEETLDEERAHQVLGTQIIEVPNSTRKHITSPQVKEKSRKKLRRRKVRDQSLPSESDDDRGERVRRKRRKKKKRIKESQGDLDGEMDRQGSRNVKRMLTRDGSRHTCIGEMVLNIPDREQENSHLKHTNSQDINSKLLKSLSGSEKGRAVLPEHGTKTVIIQNNPRVVLMPKSRVDIFTVGIEPSSKSPNIGEETTQKLQTVQEPVQKRKKKRKLHGLKKTRAVVGVKPTLEIVEGYPDSASVKSDSVYGDKTSDHRELITKEKSKEFPKPLLLCRILAGYPLLSFLIVTLAHLAVFATTAGLFISGYDVFPVVFDSLPLYIYDDYYLKELSWKERYRFSGYVYRPVYGANIATGSRSQVKDTVEVIFEQPGGNMLTKENLDWLKLSEDKLFNIPLYQNEFCLLDYYGSCVKPQSILRFFDGTYEHIDPVFRNEDFSNIHEVIYKAYLHNDTRDYLYLFMGKHSIITANYSSTDITRSVFMMGWPIGYVRIGGSYVLGTLDILTDFEADVFRTEIEYIRDHLLVDLIDVYYISKLLYEYDLVQQAMKDIMLAIGSVSFIFVFMCIQTGSVVVTFLGILSIASSFLLTNLIYRYVFQYIYFGFFHIIALFLILGIGADDLFVFYDTWRLSGNTKYPSLAHRLSDCYRRAAKTTFVTSCTTMMAFFVSGLSPLLPVHTFGIFCGVLVAINYVWVIIYFPSVIIIHHTKVQYVWKKFHTFLLSCGSSVKNDATSSTASDTNSTRSLLHTNSGSKTHQHMDTHSGTASPEHFVNIHPEPRKSITPTSYHHIDLNYIKINQESAQKGEVKLDIRKSEADVIRHALAEKKKKKEARAFQERNRVVRFLRNTFFRFMTSRVVRIAVPFIILGLSIFFIHRATLIEPDTQQLRLFRDDHNYAKATERHYKSFLRNNEDEYTRVYLVWGLLPANIDDCNTKSAVYCFGNPQYDEQFDMNSPEAQSAVKNFCGYLDMLSDTVIDNLHIRRDTITGKPQISCFTKPMETFFQDEIAYKNANSFQSYPADFSLDLPVTPGNVTTLMNYNSLIYDSMPSDFNNYFEILVSHWMTNKFTLSPTPDYFLYRHLLAEKRTDYTRGAYYSSSSLVYGTKLQYMAVEINTTLNVYQLSYKDGLPVYERYEDLISHVNNGFPSSINKGIQVTETLWHWLHVQETLASSAIMGILVGLLTAWPILVLTTFNFVIGTLATITIGLVTACVVGLIPLVGWKLGVLESINLCMVVGLSVDYVVHLAEAYRMSESNKRMDRVQGMLESIGLSVVSGAITTMGAAVFMLFAQIRFFYQFGIFIISTVGISLLFSLFGYTSFMSFCGPQGEFGNLKHICTTIKKYCQAVPDETTGKRGCCICASPSVVLDRIYDHISYGTHRPNK